MKLFHSCVLIVSVLAGICPSAWAQSIERENPRTVVANFFNAMQEGDLKGVKARRMSDEDEITQEEVDQTRKVLGDQKIAIKVAYLNPGRNRAIVVSGPVVLTLPKESGIEPASLRFVFDLEDTLGEWLIREIDYLTGQEAAESVFKFKRKYNYAIEIPPPKPATVSAKRTPRETAETFFKALITRNLKSISSVLVADKEPVTQKALDMVITGLGDQKLTVATVLIAQKQGRALVISEPFRITLSGENPPPLGRYVLDLADASGQWLIQDLNFENIDDAAAAAVEFGRRFADAREVPAKTAESRPEKANPRTVVEAYFNAIRNGDFDAANAVVNIELKRKDFEETRRHYGSQKPAVSAVFQSQTGHRACVVTDKIQLKINDVPPQPEGPLVVQLDDTRGRWLIRSILHTGNETAAKAIVEFRRKYTDAIEIAPPMPATVSAKRNPRETAETFFKALITGDLKSIAAVLVADEEQVTQNALDMVITGLGDQELTVATVLIAQKKGRALVISEPFRITLSGEDPPPIGRYVLVLSDKTGPWRIQDLDFESLEHAAEAEAGFRKQYADADEIPAPETTRAALEKSKRKLRVFEIEYADATAVSEILNELFGDLSIVVDGRTSSLLIRHDDRNELEEITEVLRLLDRPAEERRRPTSRPKSARWETQPTDAGEFPSVTSEAIETLRTGLADIERQAAAKAAVIRQVVAAKGNPQQLDRLNADLHKQVELAFGVRQKLQQTELQAIRNRLTAIQKQIESREQIRDRIIKRRLEELLDPTLQWATEELAKTESTQKGRRPGGSDPMAGLLSGPSGLQQSVSPQALVQSGGSTTATPGGPNAKPMETQVQFRNPAGTKIVWSAFQKDNTLVVPARINLKSGKQHGFMLTSIPGREGLELAGSIELAGATPATTAFLSHNAIPAEFTEEDFDQVSSGNLVTKVIFLPDPKFQEQAIAGVETVVSTRTDPGVDPVAEADRRGQILAVLRLGNRVKAATLIAPAQTSEEELELETRIEDGFGILFFHSEACPVCEKVKPDFTREMSRLGLPSLPVDVLKFPNIAKRFRVSSTPSFVWYGTEVERGRAIGAEFQPLVEKFKEYWEESDGARSGYGFGGGLRGFLRRELVKTQSSHESLMTDITSLDLTIPELGDAVKIPADATAEERKRLEQEELLRKAKIRQILKRIDLLKDELRPIEARMRLIRQRLKELDSGSTSGARSDPKNAAVWIEAIIEQKGKNGQIDAEARYMNGTIVSSDGLIAVWLGHGSTMADAVKFLRKITVRTAETSHTGKLISYDAQTGAAIIRIDSAGLPFLPISDDPIATNRRLTVHARSFGEENPLQVVLPVWVIASRFKVGDHDGFFAVTEASQNSISEEYAGAPIVTSSGQLQGILAENEGVLYGPTITPEDPKPRRAAAIPASVIRKLLKQPGTGGKDKAVNTARPVPKTADGLGTPNGKPGTPAK